MYFLLKMWIFHCYVRLPEGTLQGWLSQHHLQLTIKVASISNEEQFRTGLEQLVSPLVALMQLWSDVVNNFFGQCMFIKRALISFVMFAGVLYSLILLRLVQNLI